MLYSFPSVDKCSRYIVPSPLPGTHCGLAGTIAVWYSDCGDRLVVVHLENIRKRQLNTIHLLESRLRQNDLIA